MVVGEIVSNSGDWAPFEVLGFGEGKREGWVLVQFCSSKDYAWLCPKLEKYIYPMYLGNPYDD